MSERFVSGACLGERCFCGAPAEHKVEEAIQFDDPFPARHQLTAYICHGHFRQIMGTAADNEFRKPEIEKGDIEGLYGRMPAIFQKLVRKIADAPNYDFGAMVLLDAFEIEWRKP